MENAIKHLRIQNFKSIKDVTLKPRRVNIIIGEPNVGKSNILEAMSLLGGMVYDKKRRFMNGLLRYERANQLFYDNLISNTIKIESDNEINFINPLSEKGYFQSVFISRKAFEFVGGMLTELFRNKTKEDYSSEELIVRFADYANGEFGDDLSEVEYLRRVFDKTGNRDTHAYNDGKWSPTNMLATATEISRTYVRPYFFVKGHPVNQEYGTRYLEPPIGDNLKNTIQAFATLRKDVASLFTPYGLKLLLHMENKQLEVIKDLEGVIYSYPYNSMADTLQRLIFYLAAIESNDDAVLLFEEPETHSFPVYVSKLGRRIVESKNNQFFVATHSPYLITEVLDEMLTKDEYAGELAIFAAYYEDYQTKVHQLSDEEIFDIRADGIDVFYNMKRFTTGREDA